ncbi:myrosinase 1-like [Arctopsyche grandis]|uniref:myrosinase 1-like n=1 Tax=Arctopsyche grandis TaxID=121162 RepID=UPI00406D8296
MKFLNIPKTLRFATATGAYQVEGAWNVSDKGASLWDYIVHSRPENVLDRTTADVTCDSYHQYKRDVEMLVELGVEYYRFSITWSRLLPTGFSNNISEDGSNYYNNLINELIKNNIKPMVTLNHWDLPYVFQKMGGWANEAVIDYFEEYARVVFELYGDRVKEWITFNEPQVSCLFDLFAIDSGFVSEFLISGVSDYLCLHHSIKAHARVYHLYNNTFKPTQKGKLGTAPYTVWGDPESDSEEDIANAEKLMQFFVGWYAHPIYSDEGDYPPIVRKVIDENSARQGFKVSRLPRFTPEEVKYIRGTFDFMGFNFYTAGVPNTSKLDLKKGPSFENDLGFSMHQKSGWERPLITWLRVYPQGFRKITNWMVKQYGNHEIYILENGFATERGLNDDNRIKYYTEYLTSLLEAIDDGCNVTLYTAWTLMDNFEWSLGYLNPMGFYEVDFDSPNKTRVPRKSAKFYKQLIETRKLEVAD